MSIKTSIAGASVAKDHDADVFSRGTIGTRQADIAQLVRTRPSNANPWLLSMKRAPVGPGALVI